MLLPFVIPVPRFERHQDGGVHVPLTSVLLLIDDVPTIISTETPATTTTEEGCYWSFGEEARGREHGEEANMPTAR